MRSEAYSTFTRNECATCAGRGRVPCERCGGCGQVVSMDGGLEAYPQQPDDYTRDVHQVTGETFYRVRQIMREGVTREELARQREEARLQGRVDVGVRQIAERLRGAA